MSDIDTNKSPITQFPELDLQDSSRLLEKAKSDFEKLIFKKGGITAIEISAYIDDHHTRADCIAIGYCMHHFMLNSSYFSEVLANAPISGMKEN